MSDRAETLGTVIMGAGLVAAGIGVYAIGGAAIGALCGEICDWVPYINHAIPEGIGYAANYISPEASAMATEKLVGNLDKMGAAAGFTGGFFRSLK